MRLYIVRHTIAENRDAKKYPDDELRPLIDKGTLRAHKVARWFRQQYGVPDVLLSSPAVRALETARTFCEEFEAEDKLVILDVLRPMGSQSRVVDELTHYTSKDCVMLFGHEPNLSNLISTLLGGDSTISIHLKKCGICCLSIDNLVEGKCARLEWLLDPAALPEVEKSEL